MNLQLTPLAPGLRIDDAGVARVGESRVTLDTLVAAYHDGSTAEEIVQQFPTLLLSDVHAAIAYVLTHGSEVHAYLQQRQTAAENIRTQAQQISDQRAVRERLLARQATRKNGS